MPTTDPTETLIDLALAEDLGNAASPAADLTALWTVPAEARSTAVILTRQAGVIAGMDVARRVFERVDPTLRFTAQEQEGRPLPADVTVARIEGPTRSLLTAERTALNFLQRLSGVASLTRRFADAIEGTSARITDTRKTTPGMRLLQRRAVVLGGGVNHRFGLFDAVLIKENHAAAAGGVAQAVAQARRQSAAPAPPIMVEAENLEEVLALIPAGPDRILLDNLSCDIMRQAVEQVRAQAPNIQLEATGGITLDTVRPVAETGVDLISIGALTHSAPALDLSMLLTAQ